MERGKGEGLSTAGEQRWVGAGKNEPLLGGRPGLRLPDAGAHARDACG